MSSNIFVQYLVDHVELRRPERLSLTGLDDINICIYIYIEICIIHAATFKRIKLDDNVTCWNTHRWTIPMSFSVPWISDFAAALLPVALSPSFCPLFVLDRLSLLLWTKCSRKHYHVSRAKRALTIFTTYSCAKPTIGVGFRELLNNKQTSRSYTADSAIVC